MKVYRITADYRPLKPCSPHPYYYVKASTKSSAKKLFKDKFSWLEIYEVKEVDFAPIGMTYAMEISKGVEKDST